MDGLVPSIAPDNRIIGNDHSTYEIILETELIVQEQKVVDTRTLFLWEIIPLVIENNKGVKIIVKSQELTKIGGAYQNLAAFMQEFSRITAILEIAITEYGNISHIVNGPEIWDKWQSAKYQVTKKSPNVNDLQPIIDGGDKDYGDPTTLIKNSPIHKFFFPPIIGEKQVSHDFYPIKAYGDLPSQLYVGEKVFYEIFEQVTNTNNSRLDFTHKGKLIADKTGNFLNLYKQNYEALLGDNFKYNWGYLASYRFDKMKKVLLNADILLTEETSPSLMHRNKITISRK